MRVPIRISWFALCLALAGTGCDKNDEPTEVPEPVAVEPEPPPPVELPPPPPKVPKGSIAVGTFNLRWAFDHIDPETRPKLARDRVAKTEEDWAWKRDKVAELLVQERLDIVALMELGGERELRELVEAIEANGGYEYEWGFEPSRDRFTGQHVAVLSRFPMSNVRRLEAKLSKQLAVDVEVPGGELVTVVAAHLRRGKYKSQTKRRRAEATSLKRRVNAIQQQHPVIVLGTLNARMLPWEDEYRRGTAGILSGVDTRRVSVDDCMDSSEDGAAQRTNVGGMPSDRIFSCGMQLRAATTAGEHKIVREAEDPLDKGWADVPIEDAPYRDVSDHFIVWAELVVPPPESTDEDDESGADGSSQTAF